MTFRVMGRAGLTTSARGRCGIGGQNTAEVSQAALESFDEVGVDGWLPFRIAAWWLGPGLLRLVDAECCVKQAVRIS